MFTRDREFIPAFPLQTATSKIFSADRETASPLHSAVGYHANLMACREKRGNKKLELNLVS